MLRLVNFAFSFSLIALSDFSVAQECEKMIPAAKLAEGSLPMPLVGLGTWKSAPGEVEAAVTSALRAGYRHIDAAACYGNEEEVGNALSDAFEAGIVAREDVFVTSKLWNSEHGVDDVEAACRKTLADLQLEYLDLYLIHWPQCFEKTPGTHVSFPRNADGTMKYDTETTHQATWQELEKLHDKGLIRNIGLSNFNSAQIDAIKSYARIQPTVLQVEVHPFFNQEKLVSFCKSRDILVTAYSPLGSGSVVDGVTVPTHPTLAKVGENYGKSAAQIALRFLVQRGIAVIPKSVKETRIGQNIDIGDFKLSDEDMAAVMDLDRNMRVGWGGPLVERDGKMVPRDQVHRYYPFKMTTDGANDASAW